MVTDQVLVEQAKKGDIEAFSELVKRHQKMLLRLGIRMTRELELAEDIVQEAFVKAYQKLHMFEERSSFKSWIYQITMNTAKNKLRKKRYEHVDINNVSISAQASSEKKLCQEDLKVLILDEIDKLPKKQKMAVTLRIFDDLSFKEVAEIMGCPYDTAKANYRHGLMKLRHRFEESSVLNVFKNFEQSFIPKIGQNVLEVDI